MDNTNDSLPLTDDVLNSMNMEALMDEQQTVTKPENMIVVPEPDPALVEQERHNAALRGWQNFTETVADIVRLQRWNEFFGSKPEIDLPLATLRAQFDSEVERRDRLQGVVELLAETHRTMFPGSPENPGESSEGEGVPVVFTLYGTRRLGTINKSKRERGRYGSSNLRVKEFPTGEVELLDWKNPKLESLRVAPLSELQGLIEEATREATARELSEVQRLTKKGAKRTPEEEDRLNTLRTKYNRSE